MDVKALLERMRAHAPAASLRDGSGASCARMRVGDRVRKARGYPFPGVVVAAFDTLSGARRLVVECTADGVAGCLHVFSEGQLERI